jgi:hypothetical protein
LGAAEVSGADLLEVGNEVVGYAGNCARRAAASSAEIRRRWFALASAGFLTRERNWTGRRKVARVACPSPLPVRPLPVLEDLGDPGCLGGAVVDPVLAAAEEGGGLADVGEADDAVFDVVRAVLLGRCGTNLLEVFPRSYSGAP